MEFLLAQLDKVVEEVRGLEEKRSRLGEFIREIKGTEIGGKDVLENRVAVPVTPDPLRKSTIMGVDGGLLKQAYHAVDLILTRSVGVSFSFNNGDLGQVDYFPDAFPSPSLTVISDSHTLRDFDLASSLERVHSEARMLVEMSKKEGDLLLADGSIVLHPMDKPKGTSHLSRKYEGIIALYRELFSSGMLLAGVIEDSRSKRVSDILAESVLGQISDARVSQLAGILKSTRDSNLLFHVLKEGERSFVFRYAEEESLALKDFGNEAGNIYSFYLRTTGFDRPLRIDYYAKKDPIKTADRIASFLLPISSHNEQYGFPSVLVEADSKARLREEELDIVHSYIVDRVGLVSSLYKLRRNARPF